MVKTRGGRLMHPIGHRRNFTVEGNESRYKRSYIDKLFNAKRH